MVNRSKSSAAIRLVKAAQQQRQQALAGWALDLLLAHLRWLGLGDQRRSGLGQLEVHAAPAQEREEVAVVLEAEHVGLAPPRVRKQLTGRQLTLASAGVDHRGRAVAQERVRADGLKPKMEPAVRHARRRAALALRGNHEAASFAQRAGLSVEEEKRAAGSAQAEISVRLLDDVVEIAGAGGRPARESEDHR